MAGGVCGAGGACARYPPDDHDEVGKEDDAPDDPCRDEPGGPIELQEKDNANESKDHEQPFKHEGGDVLAVGRRHLTFG